MRISLKTTERGRTRTWDKHQGKDLQRRRGSLSRGSERVIPIPPLRHNFQHDLPPPQPASTPTVMVNTGFFLSSLPPSTGSSSLYLLSRGQGEVRGYCVTGTSRFLDDTGLTDESEWINRPKNSIASGSIGSRQQQYRSGSFREQQ